MLDFYTITEPKARKNHTCDLCCRTIHKGEVYHRYSGKYNGDMFDSKYHLHCRNIIKAYCEAMGDPEYDEESISDWLHDIHCIPCEHYENDDCTNIEFSCPYILRHYEQEGE